MKKLMFIITIVSVFISCKKEYSGAITGSNNNINSLPLADTALITDTTTFYDCLFNNSRELSIMPLGPCNIWQSKYIGYPFDFSSTLFGYDCVFSANDSLAETRLDVKIRTTDFSDTDSSFSLRRQKVFSALSPSAVFDFATDLSKPSSVIISRYDAAGTLWATNAGSANQTGSSFQIIKESGIPNGIYFRCAFSCTLYDSTGKSMTIKNGNMGISLWL